MFISRRSVCSAARRTTDQLSSISSASLPRQSTSSRFGRRGGSGFGGSCVPPRRKRQFPDKLGSLAPEQAKATGLAVDAEVDRLSAEAMNATWWLRTQASISLRMSSICQALGRAIRAAGGLPGRQAEGRASVENFVFRQSR